MPYKSGINREQISLFPETIDEYITEENEVQFRITDYLRCMEARTLTRYSRHFVEIDVVGTRLLRRLKH